MLEPDLDVFDAAKGLTNAAYDEELYIEVLQLFLEETEQGEKLNEYLKAENLKDYGILVHAMKSNLRTAGASAAADLALDLEMHCKSGDLDYVRANHPKLVEAIELVEKYIRQYLQDKI